jgi:hypothetical protein
VRTARHSLNPSRLFPPKPRCPDSPPTRAWDQHNSEIDIGQHESQELRRGAVERSRQRIIRVDLRGIARHAGGVARGVAILEPQNQRVERYAAKLGRRGGGSGSARFGNVKGRHECQRASEARLVGARTAGRRVPLGQAVEARWRATEEAGAGNGGSGVRVE